MLQAGEVVCPATPLAALMLAIGVAGWVEFARWIVG
jgi:hypothetical protein